MQAESLVKAYILTHGVEFSVDALEHATATNAKRQNVVYNLPATGGLSVANAKSLRLSLKNSSSELARPQELFLIGEGGYTTCVSAVAPVAGRQCAVVDFRDGRLAIDTPSRPEFGECVVEVRFVPQPAYYDKKTSTGRSVTRWVSACGYDEMNVWPWHDCAIGKTCTFCGINSVQKEAGKSADLVHSLAWRKEASATTQWSNVRDQVLSEILEAVALAIDDDCYREEVHLILISGNLADHQLDDQALIYSELAEAITSRYPGRFAEGAVAVTAPPRDLELVGKMKESGIDVGVFNLEAFSPDAFAKHCPGKNKIGRDQYLDALHHGVNVFGWGNSWCNFVLGLEPLEALLEGCEQLAANGITPGANVLHLDHGATLQCDPPTVEEVIVFFQNLAQIHRMHNHRPYYCQKALRTSLANEAFDKRF